MPKIKEPEADTAAEQKKREEEWKVFQQIVELLKPISERDQIRILKTVQVFFEINTEY